MSEDYSGLLITIRQLIEAIATDARQRRYWEAATKAAELARHAASLAASLTARAMGR